ncbi:MAG TPA: biotin/lipoyl-containing protein [Phototrophicaceae bacterium]|jgi:biotin carboxyl carrier protein|nr:biotin/lipoyl-containing protein [Phototrophicaceae bacterium]
MKYITTINDQKFEVEIRNDGSVWVNGVQRQVDFFPLTDSLYSLIMDNTSHEVVVEAHDGMYDVLMGGRMYTSTVLDERAQLMKSRRGGLEADSGEISIKAPMPGLIVAIQVSEGDAVKGGQTVVILESMKMQNELKAPRDGTVQRISVKAGDTVEQKKVLITIT